MAGENRRAWPRSTTTADFQPPAAKPDPRPFATSLRLFIRLLRLVLTGRRLLFLLQLLLLLFVSLRELLSLLLVQLLGLLPSRVISVLLCQPLVVLLLFLLESLPILLLFLD